MASSNHIVEDFENSFQACLAAVTNPDYFYVRDSEEVKTGVEQTIQRFLDAAKQMESFFLQKRLVLSAQKSEQMVTENIANNISAKCLRELPRMKVTAQMPMNSTFLEVLLRFIYALEVTSQNEDNTELKNELTRKEQLLQKYNEKIHYWQSLLNDTANTTGQQPQPQPQAPQGGGPQQGMPTQNQQSMPMGGAAQGLPGPLAYLERTTSNIGMPDPRR